MVNIDDSVKSKDAVKVEHTRGGGTPAFKEVEVLTEDGIFKNGTQYAKGEKAVIAALAAEHFEANGDVKILGDADTPSHVQEGIDNAKNT